MSILITNYDNGNICAIEFFDDDKKYHKDGGPAKTFYLIGGDLSSKQWFWHGLLHRAVGPAKITYVDGYLSSEQWFNKGKLHRLGDPAYIQYNIFGDVIKEQWYNDDVLISEKIYEDKSKYVYNQAFHNYSQYL